MSIIADIFVNSLYSNDYRNTNGAGRSCGMAVCRKPSGIKQDARLRKPQVCKASWCGAEGIAKENSCFL